MQASLFQEPERAIYREPLRPVVIGGESNIRLRSTQPLAISMAREQITLGNREVIIVAPCGYGKSVIACKYVENAINLGKKVWFIVDRQNLVTQMSNELLSFGIEHGVLMSGHPRWNPYHLAQVASIQTLERRGWDVDVDLLLGDEIHAIMRKSLVEYVDMRAAKYEKDKAKRLTFVGFTATPFNPVLATVFKAVINPTTTNKQIEEGNLVPIQIYSCVEADMKGAKVVGGEWTDSEVATRGSKIVGDIASTWHEKVMEVFGGPVKTIVNAASVAHGVELCEAFAAIGFNFVQLSYKDDADEKSAVITDFKRPDTDIDGLVSVGVLSRGFNVTDIQCGIDARPLRKAFSDFIQKIGRVQRCHTFPDGTKKGFGLWLCHSGNVGRFLPEMLDLFENGVSDLSDPKDAKPPRKEPTKKEKKEIFCPKCHRLWTGRGDTCPCGYKRKRASTTETVPGRMQKVDATGKGKKKAEPTHDEKQAFYSQLIGYGRDKGYKDGWAANKYKDKFSVYPRNLDSVPALAITPAVDSWIRSQNIRFAKRRA